MTCLTKYSRLNFDLEDSEDIRDRKIKPVGSQKQISDRPVLFNNETTSSSLPCKLHSQNTTTMSNNNIPVLPNNYKLTFVAEGAANVVYAIEPRSRSPRESVIEEYSETTPPPSVVEDEGGEGIVDAGFFESELAFLMVASGALKSTSVGNYGIVLSLYLHYLYSEVYFMLHGFLFSSHSCLLSTLR